MGFHRGPKLITDDLVLAIDVANVKSFRGEPTVNKISGNFDTTFDSLSNGETAGFINQLGSGNYLGVSSDFAYSGSKSLRINRGTGGTGRVYRTFSVVPSEYSSVSAWVYSTVAGPFIALEYFGGDYNWGVAYTNNVHTGSGWELIWCKTSGGATSSSTGYYFLHPSVNNVDTYWDNIQVENKQYNTPYVNGTRGTTVAAGGGVKNLSGSNHGELVNGLMYNTGNLGVLQFDGVDDGLTLGSTITLGNGSWTVAMWVSPNSFSNSYGNLISNNSGGPVSNAFGLTSAKISYDFYLSSWTRQLGNTSLTTGNWYYLVWVNNLGSMVMYVNGVSDSSSFVSTTNNGGPINSIGKNWFSTFNGKIATASIYQGKALSNEEIQQNYNATKGRFNL
jgi:hypothetical protein